jgi:hypothetical protein
VKTLFSTTLAILILSMGIFSTQAQSTGETKKPKKTSIPAELDLDKFIGTDGKVWDTTSKDFMSGDMKYAFKWLNKKHTGAHFPGYRDSPALNFLGQKIYECNTSFGAKSTKLYKFYISFYNRGDAGGISADDFDKRLEAIDKCLTEWSGDKGFTHDKVKNAGKNLFRKSWVKDDKYSLRLKWSTSGKSKKDYQAEYIELLLYKYDPEKDPRKKISKSPLAQKGADIKVLKNNVTKNDDGYIFVDNVPMVDQGGKGYCVVATSERVLKYYGQDVSQHQLAQMMDSSASNGTTIDAMTKNLKRVGRKLRIKVKPVYEKRVSVSRYEKEVKAYNKVAKKMNKPSVQVGTVSVGGRTLISLPYGDYDPDVYTEYRLTKDKSDFKNFKRDIKKYIDMGIPLTWSLMLGIIPENVPQSIGGHMRLIIGYKMDENNKDIAEIVYSDSWGEKHAFKTMPAEKAWAPTHTLIVLEPRK